MGRLRNLTMGVICIVAFISFSFVSAVAQEKPVELIFSSYLPPTHHLQKECFDVFKEKIEKNSKGRIKIKMFTSESLHPGRKGYEAIAGGVTDITCGWPAYSPGSFRLAFLVDLPFSFPDAYFSTRISEELYPKYFKSEFEALGAKLAWYGTTSNYSLFLTKRVSTVKDFKGLKVRSPGGVMSDTLIAMGLSPVSVASPEIYTSLQRGVVEVTAFSNASAESYRIWEVCKYIVPLNISLVGLPVVFNAKSLERKVPEDLKPLLYETCREMAWLDAHSYEKREAQALEHFIKERSEVTPLPPAELDKLKQSLKPVWDKFIKENEAKGLPVKQLVEDYKKLMTQYAGFTPEQLKQLQKSNPIQGIW